MNMIDAEKLKIIIFDSISRLQFLGQITAQDDISSELAGYEISKLLKQQTKLQDHYALLMKKRISLKGILNKKQLTQTQEQISDIANKLKQSTKKLCRLFKENPDIKKDAAMVSEERRDLEGLLLELVSFIDQNQLSKFRDATTKELENQDYLRKLMEREKKLNADIKNIDLEHKKEFKQYQEEKDDRKNKIQQLQQRLMYKTNRANLTQTYKDAEAQAQLHTQKRRLEYRIETFRKDKADYEDQIKVENLVFQQMKEFLIRKEKGISSEAAKWSDKHDTRQDEITQEINQLREKQDQSLDELQSFRAENERIQIERFEKERKEQEENQKKLKDQLYQIQLDNAIRFMQKEYMDWKAAGGGKKRRGKGKQKK